MFDRRGSWAREPREPGGGFSLQQNEPDQTREGRTSSTHARTHARVRKTCVTSRAPRTKDGAFPAGDEEGSGGGGVAGFLKGRGGIWEGLTGSSTGHHHHGLRLRIRPQSAPQHQGHMRRESLRSMKGVLADEVVLISIPRCVKAEEKEDPFQASSRCRPHELELLMDAETSSVLPGADNGRSMVAAGVSCGCCSHISQCRLCSPFWASSWPIPDGAARGTTSQHAFHSALDDMTLRSRTARESSMAPYPTSPASTAAPPDSAAT